MALDGGVEPHGFDVLRDLLHRLVNEALGRDVVGARIVRIGSVPVARTFHERSRKRRTPSMPLVCQGFTCSSGPMNIS